MSDLTVPPLEDVELPTDGCWVAFRSRSDIYVLRADGGEAWTLLSVRGTAVGSFRFVRAKFRTTGAAGAGRADADWREVVRALGLTPDAGLA